MTSSSFAKSHSYPIFLRLILWTWLKLLPKTGPLSEHRSTLEFLLEHPRRCYTTLFPSKHTWWLVAILITINGTDWIMFEVLNVNLAAAVRVVLLILPLEWQ